MSTHLSVLYLLNLQTHSVPAAQTDTSIIRMASVLWSAEGQRKRNLLGLNTKALCWQSPCVTPELSLLLLSLFTIFTDWGGGGPQCVICPVGGNYTPMALWSSWLCIWLAGQSAPFKGIPAWPASLLSFTLSVTLHYRQTDYNDGS